MKENLKWFVLNNGKKLKQYEISTLILNMFNDKEEITIDDIVFKIDCKKTDAQRLTKDLCTKGLLERANDFNRIAIYSKKSNCLLADLLTPKSVYKNFKVKSRTVVKHLIWKYLV